jgi:hypothetical protein
VALLGLLGAPALTSLAAGPSVLLVGPTGTSGAQYTSIQDAVDHAHAGDWVLIAPGIYHEHGSAEAGVLVQKSNLHLRGMNRTGVIVDGTRVSAGQRSGTLPPGSPACVATPSLQDLGAKDSTGHYIGQNGIMVKGASGDHAHFTGGLADNVSIENLTVCNYLKVQEGGNQVWWNGGDGEGLIGLHGLHGDYISATDTYYEKSGGPAGDYGIFTSNEDGPGVIDHSYASNMQDSSYYVGACRNCNVTLNHPHAEYSALGLSSTNAGGNLLVENGEWNDNRTGLVSNAQNNDDWPSPEYGQCVAPSTSPTLGGIPAGPDSCYVIYNNSIHDNNNNNTPGGGLTSVSALGTGIELVATQHISAIGNRVFNNKAWGIITHDFPDPESGPASCAGGTDIPAVLLTPEVCYWYSLGNHVARNTFTTNGAFGNPTNGDVANQGPGSAKALSDGVGQVPDPNCFSGDGNSSGSVSQWPATLESSPCVPGPANSEQAVLTAQLVCATGAASLFTQGTGITPPSCPGYPAHDGVCSPGAQLTPAGDRTNGVCFAPLSRVLSAAVSPTMPDPCAGVPTNAYCPAAAVVTAAPSPSPSALPLTGGGSPASLPLATLLALALVGVPFMLLRRTTGRT